MSDNEVIRRGGALAELDRHAKGTTTISGQIFRTIQLGEAAAAIAALPADDRVAKLVEAARAALQWLDDDLGASSEAQPERQNLRSALSALEAGE